jgi:hypothetical protein
MLKANPKGISSKGEDVIFCTKCGATLQDAHQYCGNCGTQVDTSARLPGRRSPSVPNVHTKHDATAPFKRFGQIFGLDPRVAFLTLIIDLMLDTGDIATMGLLLPVSIGAGIVLGYVAYHAQIAWYGDDKESAKIKAIILGLLTAIPTPLPALLYVPAGVVGLFHGFRRKEPGCSHSANA